MTTMETSGVSAITQEELFLLPALCRLVAYAVDAQRVLSTLASQSAYDADLRGALDEACADWLNPDCNGLLGEALVTLQTHIADRVAVLATSHEV